MADDPQTETVHDWSEGPRGEVELFALGTLLGDRWEIRSVLGQGGFAVVYLAFDRLLQREVALKVLREDRLSPTSLRRFLREAALARDLSHPRLVRIFDVERAGTSVFLTMEAIDGGSLRDRLIGGKKLPFADTERLGRQIFEALAALHGLGIVHRDVKPGNVLLTAEGDVKLADFGLALDLEGGESRLTATEGAIGTLDYLSPEQALGEPVDARSDLYSAGTVLYEMLTGRLPYGGRSSLGNLVARFRQRPAGVRALRHEVPAWLGRIVERLLERRPEDRYATAAGVLSDLARRRARLSAPRRRIRLAAGAVLLLGAGVVGVERWRDARGRSFSHVVVEDDGGTAEAVDRLGRSLWSKKDVRAAFNFVPFRPERGAPIRLAAILASPRDFSIDHVRVLSLLDPQNGRVVDQLELAEASREFPGFSRTYNTAISQADLDDDGSDELIVDFAQDPLWPSFSVLVEPRLRRSRVVLVASGHHWFKAAQDVDGDGRRDLLYAGINNRLGWHQGIAAVRSPEGVGRPGILGANASRATTPDRFSRTKSTADLEWYALAPRGLVSVGESLVVNAAGRRISITYAQRDPYTVDFDGFPVGEPGGDDGDMERRRSARHRAYSSMAEGSRLEDALELEAAAEAYGDALHSAAEARLPILEHWLRECRNRSRAGVVPWPEIRSEMEHLMRDDDHPSEIAYDTARALHRAGRVEEALGAYRQSYSTRGATDGRGEYEIFEGILLTLVELGRFAEADREVDRYCSSTAAEISYCSHYSQFVKWMSGRPVSLPASLSDHPDMVELLRYWNYELRLATGAALSDLLPSVQLEAGQDGPASVLFQSLEAELLGRSGRVEEAAKLAEEARDRFEVEVRREPSLRVHAALVHARAEKWFAVAAKGASSPKLPGDTRKDSPRIPGIAN
jgi:tetratricopeptide (TPR) repeat protein